MVARTVFVPFLAYFLAVQTILMPLSRAKANEAAGIDATLGILCLTHDADAGPDGAPLRKHPHDLGCCLGSVRFTLDMPIAVLSEVLAVEVIEPAVLAIAYERPQSRAPPAITATPARSRAPPVFPA